MGPFESLAGTAVESRCIFISYKRDAEPDVTVATFLYDALKERGHDVFRDVKSLPPFDEFEDPISGAITRSDFFIVLLTKSSINSRWVIAETEVAAVGETNTGRPKILPVRVAFTAGLSLRLRAAIGHLHHFEWRDTTDCETLLAAILNVTAAREQSLPEPPPIPPPPPPLVPPPPPDASPKTLVIGEGLWKSARARQLLGTTMIVGVRAGEETSLVATRAAGPGFFRARVLGDGALEVAIWSGAKYRRVQSQPRAFIHLVQGDTHAWCFERLDLDESVALKPPPDSVDPNAASFDTALVKAAWTIAHRRDATEENFLIVMTDPKA